MAKSKAKVANVEKLMGVIFGAVGLVALVVGIVIAIVYMTFMGGAKKVLGTVSEIEYGDRSGTEVTYIYEDEEYASWVSFTSSAFEEGDRIEIYVDKENPRKIELAGYMFLPAYIVGGIGAIFFVIGTVFLIVAGRQDKKKKSLMTGGRKVYAEVTGGSMNYAYRVNGRHPFKLECQYTDPYTGAVYLYSSGNTWLDPNMYLGRQVAVYVDASDYSKYYVDLDSLNGGSMDSGNDTNIYDFR